MSKDAASYRGTCNECHTRKIRCVVATEGICRSCQQHARSCVFSLRTKLGRPRTRKRIDDPKSSRESFGEIVQAPNHKTWLHAGWEGADDFSDILDAELWSTTPNSEYESIRSPFGTTESAHGYNTNSSDGNPTVRNSYCSQNIYSPPFPVGLNSATAQFRQYSGHSDSNYTVPITRHHNYVKGDSVSIPSSRELQINPLLSGFARLAKLQFELHNRRAQLSATKDGTIIGPPDLDSIFQSVTCVCDVARDLVHTCETTNKVIVGDNAMQELQALIVLALTTVTEALSVYSVLVKHPTLGLFGK